jgi:hypothetical protein
MGKRRRVPKDEEMIYLIFSLWFILLFGCILIGIYGGKK